jgi:ATP-dependent Lon protease
VPSGAVPKDGPSAGITIATSLASILTRRRVRSDVAMTGEISLRGRILPVGGVKEKVLAAARAKIKKIILPERNRNDWAEIPAEVRQKIKVHFVDQIADVLRVALHPKTACKS